MDSYVQNAAQLRTRDFFLPREVEFSLRVFGMHSDDLELFLLENSRPVQSTGCWEWTGTCTQDGYGLIHVQRTTIYVHRTSYLLYKGNIGPAKPWVLHSCDNPPCFNPEHLRAGTPKENAEDRVARGRSGARACVPVDDALRIATAVFAMRADGLTQEAIGLSFGKSQGWASNVLANKAFSALAAQESAQ